MLVHRLQLDAPAREVDLTLTIGDDERRMHVVGDRRLVHGVPSARLPFTEMPLTWARAYGGMPVFEVAPDARLPVPHPTNPLGRGYFPTQAAEALTEMLGYADKDYPHASEPPPLLPNLLPAETADGDEPGVLCWAPMPGAVPLRFDLPAAPEEVTLTGDDDPSRHVDATTQYAHQALVLPPPPSPNAAISLDVAPGSPSLLHMPRFTATLEAFVGETPPPAASNLAHDAAGAAAFVPAIDPTPSAPMSPEAYARLVHATYQKPAAARDAVHRVHRLDEAKRAQLDAAMASYMKREPEAFRIYMQWVHHLRRGGGA